MSKFVPMRDLNVSAIFLDGTIYILYTDRCAFLFAV